MIMKLAGRCAAAALGAALFALPASAQSVKGPGDLSDAQQAEMYCVYDDISTGAESFDVIAEHFVYSDQNEADAKKAEAALSASENKCAAKYGWNDKKKAVAGDIGFYGTAVDYLTDDLFFGGVDDKDIDKVFAILDTLSDPEITAFLSGSWSKDAALTARINTKLKAAGLPDDEYTLETGRYVIEAAALASEASFDWIDTYAK